MISAADCPTVDNGHIVPRMYQRAWEVEGRRVAVHESGCSECDVKSSKLVGARGSYYRRTRPRHGTQTDDIEASLAHVENKGRRPYGRSSPASPAPWSARVRWPSSSACR